MLQALHSREASEDLGRSSSASSDLGSTLLVLLLLARSRRVRLLLLRALSASQGSERNSATTAQREKRPLGAVFLLRLALWCLDLLLEKEVPGGCLFPAVGDGDESLLLSVRLLLFLFSAVEWRERRGEWGGKASGKRERMKRRRTMAPQSGEGRAKKHDDCAQRQRGIDTARPGEAARLNKGGQNKEGPHGSEEQEKKKKTKRGE